MGVDNTSQNGHFFKILDHFAGTRAISKGEDGLIPQILEELRVCAANLHKLVGWCLPKAHLRQVNLQRGQNQRGLAQSGYHLHTSEFGGNLRVNNKSSFVEIVFYIQYYFWPNPLSKFLKISHHALGFSVWKALWVRCAVEIKCYRSCLWNKCHIPKVKGMF